MPGKSPLAGNAAEMVAMVACSLHGYHVSIPFGGKSPYDFILDNGERLYRVQVKEIYAGKVGERSRWMVDFMKPRGAGLYKRYEKYTESDCDLIVAVCVPHNAIYVFPIADVLDKRQASFYFDSPPSALARNTSWTETYRDNWPKLLTA